MVEGEKATKAVAAKTQQAAAAKRATLEMFLSRKPHEAEFKFNLGDDEVTMLFRSVGSVAYDKMLDRCPPTKEQVADGSAYNPDEFMPLLLSKVCIDPAFTLAEWKSIFSSESYGRGEVSELFFSAVGVCNRQLGMTVVNPTGSDSE
jgi:hypothetical protein